MRRKKAPSTKKDDLTSKSKKRKLKFIVDSLSHGWLPEERETSILFDREEKRVYLETSYPPTARRWLKNLWGDPEVKWDANSDTLKFSVPWDYCRTADLIIKAKHREYEGE